jgi:signal transduction histidine kinase
MRLAHFIRENPGPIIREWVQFARSLTPASDGMSRLVLRNHVKDLLDFIADDLETPQSKTEQIEKSHGVKADTAEESAAETHAALRFADGFNMDQMVAEYRALRASVIKLWETQRREPTNVDFRDLTRFNEALDQQMTESIRHYTKKSAESKDMFLGILSHDLRNPLGSMTMSAALAPQMGALTEQQMALMSTITRSGARATEIVDHLLDLTRVRLGSGLAVVREPMDMGAVSTQMVDEMRALHPSREFALEISGDMKGSWDKARIGQVFSNLLGNAVRYSVPHTPIRVKVEGPPDEVVLSVQNYGAPIPADAIRRIFDSLTRAEVPDGEHHPESVNLGLGLYITKEIVSAHGGTIGVTSSEVDGTNFTVRLPRGR